MRVCSLAPWSIVTVWMGSSSETGHSSRIRVWRSTCRVSVMCFRAHANATKKMMVLVFLQVVMLYGMIGELVSISGARVWVGWFVMSALSTAVQVNNGCHSLDFAVVFCCWCCRCTLLVSFPYLLLNLDRCRQVQWWRRLVLVETYAPCDSFGKKFVVQTAKIPASRTCMSCQVKYSNASCYSFWWGPYGPGSKISTSPTFVFSSVNGRCCRSTNFDEVLTVWGYRLSREGHLYSARRRTMRRVTVFGTDSAVRTARLSTARASALSSVNGRAGFFTVLDEI